MPNRELGRIPDRELDTLNRSSIQLALSARVANEPAEHQIAVPQLVEDILKILNQQLRQGGCVRLRSLGCLSVAPRENHSQREHIKLSHEPIGDPHYEFGVNDMIDTLKRNHPQVKRTFLRALYREFISQLFMVKLGRVQFTLQGVGDFYPVKEKTRDKKSEIKIAFRCADVIYREINKAQVA